MEGWVLAFNDYRAVHGSRAHRLATQSPRDNQGIICTQTIHSQQIYVLPAHGQLIDLSQA